jgi:hypothetical protein
LANPQNATDGDTLTLWMSSTANSQWIYCDLRADVRLTKIVVDWGWNYATSYRVEYGPNGLGWDTIRTVSDGNGGIDVFDGLNVAARYVRIWLGTRLNLIAGGFVLRELEVYGSQITNSVKVRGTETPTQFSLFQNYPNPFNPSTTIKFALPVRSRVSLRIFNLIGQQVAEILNSQIDAGYHSRVWNARLSSGVYFCRMEAQADDLWNQRFQQTMKIILLR